MTRVAKGPSDLDLIRDAAAKESLKLPGISAVVKIYEEAMEKGKGDLDYAAVLDVLESP